MVLRQCRTRASCRALWSGRHGTNTKEKPGTDAGLPACTLRGPNGRLHSRRTLPRRVSTIDCDGLGPLAPLVVLRQLVPRPRHVEQQRPVLGGSHLVGEPQALLRVLPILVPFACTHQDIPGSRAECGTRLMVPRVVKKIMWRGLGRLSPASPILTRRAMVAPVAPAHSSFGLHAVAAATFGICEGGDRLSLPDRAR